MFYDLDLVNPDGMVIQTGEAVVDHAFTFVQGRVFTSATAALVMTENANPLLGYNTNKYVAGRLTFRNNSPGAESYFYPLGKNGAYRPLSLDLNQGFGTMTSYTGEFYTADGRTLGYTLPGTIAQVSRIYWGLDQSPTSPVSNAHVDLYFRNTDVTDPTVLEVVKSQAGNWVDLNGTVTPPSPAYGFVRSDGFTQFSDFALGDDGTNPLSLVLLNFSGRKAGVHVDLQWQVDAEIEVQGFVVERSLDGRHFERIGMVERAEAEQSRYAFRDEGVLEQVEQAYYRLRFADEDGQLQYSGVLRFGGDLEPSVRVYPNPAVQYAFVDLIGMKGDLQLRLVGSDGRVVLERRLEDGVDHQQLRLDLSDLARGTYHLLLKGLDYEKTLQLIVR